ncbi:hypothetical protein GCM10020254_09930 [Streptomyces goshikiensis]
MARETAAATAATVVTTARSWEDRNIAHATARVPASIADTATAATTARETATLRRRSIRRATAPRSPAAPAPSRA